MKKPETLTIHDEYAFNPKKIISQNLYNELSSQTQVAIPAYNEKTSKFEIEITKKEKIAGPYHGIKESALDLIGQTPMVRLTRFAKAYGIPCDLVAKCEFMSIGGSVKDRAALQMVTEAEEQGRLKSGDTLIEASSGNMGISLSIIAAIKKYNMIVTLPEKMSQEKFNTLLTLGAEVVRTPTEAAWDDHNSHIGLAYKLQNALERAHMLDQYGNPANPRAHYKTTAEEIIEQCEGKVDVVVISAGTGGTISGIGANLKKSLPNCKVIGVDPYGSILSEPDSLNAYKRGKSYLVEGIGYDFIPSSLNRSYVSQWVKTDDEESFRLARSLIHLEGLLIGATAGAALAGLLRIKDTLKPGMRCVLIFPDSCRNYMTKFVSNDWMIDHGFYPLPKPVPQLQDVTIESLLPLKPFLSVNKNTTCAEAIELFLNAKTDHACIVILENSNTVLGLAFPDAFLKYVVTPASVGPAFSLSKPVLEVADQKFKILDEACLISHAAHMIQIHKACVVMNENKLHGIITAKDIFPQILRIS